MFFNSFAHLSIKISGVRGNISLKPYAPFFSQWFTTPVACYELFEAFLVFVYLGQGLTPPKGVVVSRFSERHELWGLWVVVVLPSPAFIFIEVNAVRSRMAENAVKNDFYAVLLSSLSEKRNPRRYRAGGRF